MIAAVLSWRPKLDAIPGIVNMVCRCSNAPARS